MQILILGVTGMLGNALFTELSRSGQHEVWGTVRGKAGKRFFSEPSRRCLLGGVDVLDEHALTGVLNQVRPDVVINAVGVAGVLLVASIHCYRCSRTNTEFFS